MLTTRFGDIDVTSTDASSGTAKLPAGRQASRTKPIRYEASVPTPTLIRRLAAVSHQSSPKSRTNCSDAIAQTHLGRCNRRRKVAEFRNL
jgi:hypothetical protein